MPTQTLPIPRVTAADFEHIPDTDSYVVTTKLLGPDGSPISGIQGYRMVQMAQNLGLYLTSSEEWGKSRRYFQKNPDMEFGGRTGKEIETDYISGYVEQVDSLLSFKEKGEFQGYA